MNWLRKPFNLNLVEVLPFRNRYSTKYPVSIIEYSINLDENSKTILLVSTKVPGQSSVRLPDFMINDAQPHIFQCVSFNLVINITKKKRIRMPFQR